jgi:predicted DCC family thiol-disulfide oxidoreductase YuxK
MWILFVAILILSGGLTIIDAPARSRRHAAEREAVLQALSRFRTYATEASVFGALERVQHERMSARTMRAHLVALEEDGAVLAYSSGETESLVRRYRLLLEVSQDTILASPAPQGSGALTVYHDGSCPLCAAEISIYKRAYGAKVFTFVDVADPNVILPPDLTRQLALSRFHVQDASGTLVSGAAAFAVLWRALPRWRWLGQLVGAASVLPLAEKAYQASAPLRPHLARLIIFLGVSRIASSPGKRHGLTRRPQGGDD